VRALAELAASDCLVIVGTGEGAIELGGKMRVSH